jgi:hypothetical protein
VGELDDDPADGELGGDVEDAAAAGVEAGGRDRQDDASLFGREGLERSLRRQQVALDVHGEEFVERGVEGFIGDCVEVRVVVEQADEADERIEGAERRERLADGALVVLARRAVALDGEDARSELRQPFAFARIELEHGDARALGEKGFDGRPADPRAAADGECGLSIEPAHGLHDHSSEEHGQVLGP